MESIWHFILCNGKKGKNIQAGLNLCYNAVQNMFALENLLRYSISAVSMSCVTAQWGCALETLWITGLVLRLKERYQHKDLGI